MRFQTGIMLLLTLLLSVVVHAADEPIVFSTAPTHSKQETIKLYTPLMSYLSKVTGREFVVEPAANFVEYSVRMRKGHYDMVFDGPHLTGWRMVHMGHRPVARFPGTIRIVVAVNKDSPIKKLQDLEDGSTKVCAFASPNMLTMAFLSYFPNPARQPMMLRTQGFAELNDCIKQGKGEAVVLRDKLWEKMKDKQNLRLLPLPRHGYPERTFSVGPRVDEALRQKIATALMSVEGSEAGKAVLARFKKKAFITAEAAEYGGMDLLLRPVWGFHE